MRLWTNGYDYVIAGDVIGARRVAMLQHGYADLERLDQTDETELDGDGWVALPLDQQFTLHDEERPTVKTTKSVREWIAESAPDSYFACTEY